MAGCSAVGCSNSTAKGAQMHRFPQDAARRRAWEAKVARKNWRATNSSYLCSAHFRSDQYEANRADGKRRLVSTAIPTEFCHRKPSNPRSKPRIRQPDTTTSANPHQHHDYAKRTCPEARARPVIPSPSLDVSESMELEEMCERDFNNRLEEQLNTVKDELYKVQVKCDRLESSLSSVKKVFTENQLAALSQTSVRSHKWDEITVQKALQTKFACGTTGYRNLLEQGMPLANIRTLQRRLQQVPFTSGILNEVFSYMKIKVNGLRMEERRCCLTLDEMALKQSVDFDPMSGSVIGHADMPGSQGLATHAYVFMLAGITSRWKQVVCYYFTGNKTDGSFLADIIKQILSKANSIGLNVMAVTSDMGSTNRAMWKQFNISATNTSVQSQIPHPANPEASLYFLADVPHLVKNLKQAFLTHKQFFLFHSIVQKYNLPSNCISIHHIRDLLDFQADKQLKLAPQLTEAILSPGQFEKMKVSHALHLFSRAVSAGLRYLIAKEGRDSSYETTAWFVDLINTWFDLMSSRHPVMALSKSNASAYIQAIDSLQTVIEVINFLSIDSRSAWKPVQTGIKLSTTSVLKLADTLLDTQPYLLTSRLSQDCLENLFSSVRLKGPTPSAKEFKAILKIITISQYLKVPDNTNYLQDDREYLAEFLSTGKELFPVSEEEDMDLEVVECDLDEAEESSLYYLTGYCLHSLQRTRQLQCVKCRSQLISSSPPDDIGYLTKLKEYKEGALCHPSKAAYDVCRAAEDVVRAAESSIFHHTNIVNRLSTEVLSRCPQVQQPTSSSCHCYLQTLVSKYCTVRIKIMCRKLSKDTSKAVILSSKSLAMRGLVKNINKHN